MYAFNRLRPCKLKVWEWVVKRRIFDPFSEYSEWVSSCLVLLRVCIYGPSGRASVVVSPLPRSGVMLCSKCPLTIWQVLSPARRSDCLAPSFRRHTARKQLSKQLHLSKYPSNILCERPEQSQKHMHSICRPLGPYCQRLPGMVRGHLLQIITDWGQFKLSSKIDCRG